MEALTSWCTSITSATERAFEGGGYVMLPLAAVTLALWWTLARRTWSLYVERPLAQAKTALEGLRAAAKSAAPTTLPAMRVPTLERGWVDEVLGIVGDQMSQGRRMARTLVLCAPLLGLLGTVIGMIETFDALSEMALYRRSGGVAGGVSQALISTQVGLCVAVPGLLVARLLERRQRRVQEQLDGLAAAEVSGLAEGSLPS